MSVALQRVVDLLALSIRHVALNPIISAALLWILTKGPPNLKNHLTSRVAALRDPTRYAQIVKALKWCLALGVIRGLNKQLNQVALNSGRINSARDKSKWDWNGEVAVITGGCSGIGELVVKKLVDKGIKVAILDIQQLPSSLRDNSNINFFACDVTDPPAVYATAEKIKNTLGSPTILINNAGILASQTILSTSDIHLKKIFEVNVLSNWYTVKAFLPDMISAKKGHIVTVASAASYISIGGLADYTATKSAILAFHEALNQELKHHYASPGILTTSIHPNWVRTPLLASVEPALKKSGSKMIEPEVVANSIVAAITGCQGGQVFLPKGLDKVTWLRGLPNWVQESVRSGVSKMISDSIH